MKAKVCIVVSGIIAMIIVVFSVLEVDISAWEALLMCAASLGILYYGTKDGIPETSNAKSKKEHIAECEQVEARVVERLVTQGYGIYPISEKMTLYVKKELFGYKCYMTIKTGRMTRRIQETYDQLFWEAMQAEFDDVEYSNVLLGLIILAKKSNQVIRDMLEMGTYTVPLRPIRATVTACIDYEESAAYLSQGRGFVLRKIYKQAEKDMEDLIIGCA